MSRVEDFSAELVSPEVFREICSLVASVGRTSTLLARGPRDDPEVEEDELVIYAINSQNALQVWAHLTAMTMFLDWHLVRSERVELKSENLKHALRSEQGLLAMNEIKLRMSRRAQQNNEDYGTPITSQLASTVGTTRLISIKMDQRVEGHVQKNIEQRIYAEAVDADIAPSEPTLDGITIWADPSIQQLSQMATVCDQCRNISDTITITISSRGTIELVTTTPDVVARSSFQVALAHRADEQSQEVSEEPAEVETASCCLGARDWYAVLQARRLCRRLVIGVLEGQGAVVYGFLKRGRSMSTADVVNFYLSHQAI